MPPLKTSLEYLLGSVAKDWGMTRAEFDNLPVEEQERHAAHYLATAQIQKWQNHRDKLRVANATKK